MTRKLLACSIFAATASLGFAHAQTTINTGGSSLAAPSYISEYQTYTAANPSILFNYEAVGSGSGQAAFLNNDITKFENLPAGTLTYGTIVGTQVDIGASDAFLLSSQLTNEATGSYGTPPEGSTTDGPVIQIPTFGTPITVPYNQTGIPKAGLTLTDAQVCSILSGQTTDWHSLKSTIEAGTPITVVYRFDSSGTSFLLTQHLNAVCNSSNSTFPNYPVPITKTFATIWTAATPTALPVPSNFISESGSSGVASYMVATANTIGYLSPDFTAIAPKSASTTSLRTALLVNATTGKAYSARPQPTPPRLPRRPQPWIR
jgi:phosphate transport system substrate-binding protein